MVSVRVELAQPGATRRAGGSGSAGPCEQLFDRALVADEAVAPRARARQQLRRPDVARPLRLEVGVIEALLRRKPGLRLARAQELQHVGGGAAVLGDLALALGRVEVADQQERTRCPRRRAS